VRYDGGGASFCIDSTEVTEADYAAYVAARAGTALDVGAPCGAVTAAAPAINRGGGSLPVTGVTFCDARAFCAWAGKRLCGNVDGGVVADGHYTPTESQWYSACSGGTSAAVILSGACALDAGTSPREAGTTCEGAARGLFDMVGNVWEWIDAPRSLVPDGGGPYGSFVGGSYTNLPWYSCDTASSLPGHLEFQAQDVGFRCCSP
jgi:formylglycine-generating enzyme required for sulfatase activity